MKKNPFAVEDKDRYEIWDMLVRKDIDAFVSNDWATHEADFLTASFFGIDGGHSDNPDTWECAFNNLDSYAKNWQGFAEKSFDRLPKEEMIAAHHAATTLRDIDIKDDFAVCHKKFDGSVTYSDGEYVRLSWQTVYFCRKKKGRWWIAGFVGFLPNPMGTNAMTSKVSEPQKDPIKAAPKSEQHKTAGPYSPVLEVSPGKIVVISGQAPVDKNGNVPSDDFEEQTRLTMNNALDQLKAAGCDFSNVFKVNVYLTDLDDWPQFNEIYSEIMPEPRPVRTAIESGLLLNFRVEVEMWAVKE